MTASASPVSQGGPRMRLRCLLMPIALMTPLVMVLPSQSVSAFAVRACHDDVSISRTNSHGSPLNGSFGNVGAAPNHSNSYYYLDVETASGCGVGAGGLVHAVGHVTANGVGLLPGCIPSTNWGPSCGPGSRRVVEPALRSEDPTWAFEFKNATSAGAHRHAVPGPREDLRRTPRAIAREGSSCRPAASLAPLNDQARGQPAPQSRGGARRASTVVWRRRVYDRLLDGSPTRRRHLRPGRVEEQRNLEAGHPVPERHDVGPAGDHHVALVAAVHLDPVDHVVVDEPAHRVGL